LLIKKSEHSHKAPSYLSKTKTKKNFNLMTSDISGAQPRSHFKKLEKRINRAKHKIVKPDHTCGGYNPYEPSLINLKREFDETRSHMLEVDYRQVMAKRGDNTLNIKPKSGKYILVKGIKKYIDTTTKEDFINDRREQRNKIPFLNDLSKKKDRVNNPEERSDKHIRRKGTKRRDCSQDYKYIAKPERKEYVNKKDLRYDVLDINKKQIKFVPDELENDPEYLAYRKRIDKAGREGYMPEIYNVRIDKFAQFENGRRIWRSKSASRIDQLSGLRSKRSSSPMRPISRHRMRRHSHISKDEVDIKPYNDNHRELE
jgi:hypothetical protein